MELIQDRYQVETLLGRGGIGDTFRVIDQKTGQKVALKQVSLTETTWKSIELFEREAEVLQQIDHPGIPKYIDAFYVDEVANRTYYIVQTLAVSGPCIESEKFWSLRLHRREAKRSELSQLTNLSHIKEILAINIEMGITSGPERLNVFVTNELSFLPHC